MEEMLKKLLAEMEAFRQETKVALDRIEKKLDATFEQAAKGAEHQTVAAETLNRHDHGMNILNRKLFNLELDVEKIKNR